VVLIAGNEALTMSAPISRRLRPRNVQSRNLSQREGAQNDNKSTRRSRRFLVL
jgi:hypothetical protein